MSPETPDSPGQPNSKVANVIEKYDLDGFGEALEQRWLADDGESLRTLADVFNRRVLAAALGAGPSEGGIETDAMYERLTDPDVPDGERREARRRLERAGLDVDELLDSFVSHQAMHTYLTSYRGASYPERESENQLESVEVAVNRLQSRLVAVAESNLERLAKGQELTAGSLEVLVSVDVYCDDCRSSKPFVEFLETGGCDCSDEVA